MPLLNPQRWIKTYKIEDIESITLIGFTHTVSDNGVWTNPKIKVNLKKKEEDVRFIKINENIEYDKETGKHHIHLHRDDGWHIPYGSYDTLKEAKEMVTFLEAHDWLKEDYEKRINGDMWISDCYTDKSCIMCESTNLVNDNDYVVCLDCGMKFHNDMKDNEWWNSL